jgi:hypothetical protein
VKAVGLCTVSCTSWYKSLPGGVLVGGGSDGGRKWLLRLAGQAAAQQHGAHVLKVRVDFQSFKKYWWQG